MENKRSIDLIFVVVTPLVISEEEIVNDGTVSIINDNGSELLILTFPALSVTFTLKL